MQKQISAKIVFAATLLSLFGFAGLALAKSDDTDNAQNNGHEKNFQESYAKIKQEPNKRVCTDATDDAAACHAHVVTDAAGNPKTNSLPSGYGPTQLHAAYGATAASASKKIIAIVDAYDDPNILSDLNTYSATFGLPTMKSCAVATATAGSPCFQKVDQRGGTRYPQANAGWALEIALDVEISHAMCQNCSILLVEADSNSFANLLAAEDRAGILGANTISNSWGGSEFSGETGAAYDGHFNKPGILITASSGDNGYGTSYPAASRYVTAVGGTSLILNTDGTYKTEGAWSGTGSGCSSYETKPLWQTDTGCTHRTIADVSAVADPVTGAAVYDSVRYSGQSGWFKVGGTSLSSPLIASMFDLGAGAFSPNTPYLQGNASNLHAVVTGSNGSCGGNYLCTATIGYDGPTGLGTPNGPGAF